MTRPAVSICIPSYNYAHYLGEAVRSACEQTYGELEVVIIDDRSTDGTLDMLDRIASQDRRIRCHVNERNLGLQGNFNRCIELARTEYVKILCADDLLAPSCVEKMIGMFARDPAISLVACAREFVDADLRHRGSRGYASHTRVEPGTVAINRCFFRGNLIGEPTAVMFRKALAQPGFDEAYKQVIDMELWLRLLERGALGYIAEPLCRFRQHRGRATFKHIDTGIIAADRVRLFHGYSGKPYLDPGLANRLLWDLRMAWVLGRERATAADYRSRAAHQAVYFPALLDPLVCAARAAARLGLAPRPS